MTFIDYIPLYYRSIAKTAVPTVVSGKFIQLRNGNELFLVLSPKEFTKYHANIVDRFCMDRGIEGGYNEKRDLFTIVDTAWRIIGGGKFEIDSDKKTARLYGDSMAYGKFQKEGLREILARVSVFGGYTILIE